MARHALNDNSERLTAFIGIQLTASQRSALGAAAELDGATLSQYCRHLLFDRIGHAVMGSRRNSEIAMVMREVLSPIGNNLNQIAYHLNRSGGSELDRELLVTVERHFERALSKVLDLCGIQ
jgi:hypothetical protein